MTHDGRPLMYEQLAGWFHLLTPPSDYANEAAEVLHLLEASVEPPLETALELGSGGGNVASHLTGRLRLTLTDPAPSMLDLSRSINPEAEHVEADMRTLRLDRTFDSVIAHDAIGYMTSEADLRAAFETAFVHLRPGGAAVFLPDWTTETFEPTTETGGRDEGGRGLRYLEWDRDLAPDGHTVVTDYVIVTRDETGQVRVHHDEHVTGVFPRETWLRLLTEVGFQPRRVVGDEDRDLFIGVRG